MKYFALSLIIALSFFISCDQNTTSTGDEEQEENGISVPVELECSDGMSDEQYECDNIDLAAHLTPEELQGKRLNDVWGWTDPETGKEYALVGLTDGVTFVDISDPVEPVVIGKLEESPSVSGSNKSQQYNQMHHDDKDATGWRDFKVYEDHLFIVSDLQPHGMQVFDLTKLSSIENPPVTFTEDMLYEEFGPAHNIAINKETGFAYAAGSNTHGGGLHIVDIQSPLQPEFAGFHSDSTVGNASTGYVHDTQCVIYEGPDEDFQGNEICMNSSETHLVIADVSDKENPTTVSKASYDGNAYAHQGWLTEDQRYFLLDDEGDERHDEAHTRTYIWDVQDLDNPEMIGVHEATTRSIDHNLYVKGDFVYQANYTSGLRILSLENVSNGELQEVASFDTFPANNAADFDGAWSNYPYFESGIVVVSDISNGLFILQPNLE